MKLYFVRHGQTMGDVEDRYGGAYDDDLSAEGVAQAERLGQELAGRGIGKIITSGLKRARQTGEILAGHLNVETIAEPAFNERNQYGELTGMVKAEARRLHPDLVERLKDRLFTAPGAESYEDFSLKIQRAFEEIAAGASGSVIVWHGGGMRVLFRDILKLGELVEIGDCCWVELKKSEDKWEVGESGGIRFGY